MLFFPNRFQSKRAFQSKLKQFSQSMLAGAWFRFPCSAICIANGSPWDAHERGGSNFISEQVTRRLVLGGWLCLLLLLRWVVFVWARKLAGGGRDGRINTQNSSALSLSPASNSSISLNRWTPEKLKVNCRSRGVHLRKRERFLHLERLTDAFLRLLWHFLALYYCACRWCYISLAIGSISISRWCGWNSHGRLNVFLLPKQYGRIALRLCRHYEMVLKLKLANFCTNYCTAFFRVIKSVFLILLFYWAGFIEHFKSFWNKAMWNFMIKQFFKSNKVTL
jgi:hypothetical protein